MKVTDALLGEHGVLRAVFDRTEELVSNAEEMGQIQAAVGILRALISSHAALEQELIFPELEQHLGTDGPIAVMRAEHDDIDRAFEQIEVARDTDHALGLVRYALDIARDHFGKEEAIIFPSAERTLSEQTLTRLGSLWARSRRVHLD